MIWVWWSGVEMVGCGSGRVKREMPANAIGVPRHSLLYRALGI